jgi:shikimate dehydrogenase
MARPYAEVIGDPVGHSKSPLIHNLWLERLGVQGEYRGTRVGPEELADYLESRRFDPDWRGCNLTMPLKAEVVPLLDIVDDSADKVKAVNCVVSDEGALVGANTDISGLSCTLGLFDPIDPVILIGTGGAARAALYVLHEMGAITVHVFGRSRKIAQTLLDEFEQEGDGCILEDRPDVDSTMRLINATPLGMIGQPPMPERGLALVDRLPHYAHVLDMIYDPLETELMARARAKGLVAVNGLEMLVEQAREAFEIFFGVRPSHDFDDELFRKLTS